MWVRKAELHPAERPRDGLSAVLCSGKGDRRCMSLFSLTHSFTHSHTHSSRSSLLTTTMRRRAQSRYQVRMSHKSILALQELRA